MILVFSLLIGIVAGLRTMTAPAAVALAASRGWIAISSTPIAFMGYRWTPWVFGLLAVAELVTDQLPSTPSRKVPVQFAARLVSGALAGATLGAARQALVEGAILGVIGALVGTLGGSAVRSRLASYFGRDLPAALTEDVIAVGGALLLVAAV